MPKTSTRVVLRASFKLGDTKRPASIKQHVLGPEHAKLFGSLVRSNAYESLLTNKRNTARTKTGFTAVSGQIIKPIYEQGVLPRYPVFVKANIAVLTSSRLVVNYTVDLKRDTKQIKRNAWQRTAWWQPGQAYYVKQVHDTYAHRRESLRVLARVLKSTFSALPKIAESMFGCVVKPSMLPWPAKYVFEHTAKPVKRAPS